MSNKVGQNTPISNSMMNRRLTAEEQVIMREVMEEMGPDDWGETLDPHIKNTKWNQPFIDDSSTSSTWTPEDKNKIGYDMLQQPVVNLTYIDPANEIVDLVLRSEPIK